MRSIKILFLFNFLMGSLPAFAGQESTINASVPHGDESSSTLQWKPSVSMTLGSSSNVGKLQNETPGTYGKVSPSLGLEYAPSDTVVLTSQLSADLRQYTAQDTKPLGDESNYEFRNLGIWFPNDAWEIGGDLGAVYTQNSLPVQVSSTQTTALEQRYLEPDMRLYAAWSRNNLSFEGGSSGKARTYSTLLEDRGNSYHNDFSQYGVDLKTAYSISSSYKISLRGALENRKYRERPADFTDGAASNPATPLPVLEESASEFNLINEYSIGKVKLVSTPGVRFNKDKIFGARDSQAWKLQQKVAIPFSERFSWTPAFTLSQESFTRFRSDPDVDPFGSPLRKDLDLKISSPFKYSLSRTMQILADYTFTRKDSNYANSSYSEHAVSTGLSVSM